MKEIVPELLIDHENKSLGWTDGVRIRVGTLHLHVAEVGKFGQRVTLQKSDPDKEFVLIPSKRWRTLGFFRQGRCSKIDKEISVTEVLQVVRDLAVRLKFNPMPKPNLRVAVGNDKLFTTDDTCSWEIRHSELGVSCWHSPVGNRAAWPDSVVPLSTWGRPVVPVPWVMDLVRKHVSQLVDPYAWKDKDSIRLGGRRDECVDVLDPLGLVGLEAGAAGGRRQLRRSPVHARDRRACREGAGLAGRPREPDGDRDAREAQAPGGDVHAGVHRDRADQLPEEGRLVRGPRDAGAPVHG